MSRYSISAQQPGLTVIVGWDNPLTTFFAQVFDPSIEDDEAACLLWIGTAPEAIPTVAALQAQLVGWAAIPPTSWTASRATSRQPRRRPRSSNGRTSSCITQGSAVPTVPSPEPEGRHALPSDHRVPVSSQEGFPCRQQHVRTPTKS
jgi:hypothetical protein